MGLTVLKQVRSLDHQDGWSLYMGVPRVNSTWVTLYMSEDKNFKQLKSILNHLESLTKKRV